MDFDQLFPGRFLKAGEFQGRAVTLTITAVALEDLPQEKGGDRAKGIVSFAESKRQLVLNRTNGECIKAMFGRNTDDWIGKRVTLYPAPYEGDIAIRVKGSPDIEKNLTVEIKLPRKRPYNVTLEKTTKAKPAPVVEEVA
jgi:hypothetical protein